MRKLATSTLNEIVEHYERTFVTPELFPEYVDAMNERARRRLLERASRMKLSERHALVTTIHQGERAA